MTDRPWLTLAEVEELPDGDYYLEEMTEIIVAEDGAVSYRTRYRLPEGFSG